MSSHTRALATELLDDIELSRLSAEKLLLKVSRLARLAGTDEIRNWLRFELYGYNSRDETSLKYLGWTGRWINYEDKTAVLIGLAEIEARIDALRTKLETLKLPSLSGEYVGVAITGIRTDAQQTTEAIGRLSGIQSKVMALIHRFVSDIHYEQLFSGRQETMFENAKTRIDSLLAPLSGDVLRRVESVYKRLTEDDPEAVSQAMNTCRRLIDTFADAIFPARGEPVTVDGMDFQVGEQHHLNRIEVFVRQNSVSDSRKRRLRRKLRDLYERVTVGVHSDVSPPEARFLFLDTYVLLGEIIDLNPEIELPAPAETQGNSPADQ